jgi:hypothetical protein
MSSTGNRGNPNQTRIAGHQEKEQPHAGAGGQQSGSTHQESRDHNKHNNSGQSGHKPQQHSPAQEKR